MLSAYVLCKLKLKTRFHLTMTAPASCDTLTCVLFVGAPLLLAAVLFMAVALGLRRPAVDENDTSDEDTDEADSDGE